MRPTFVFAQWGASEKLAPVGIILNNDSGEEEIRTLAKGESFFWLHPAEVNAGVVVMVRDAAGDIRRHSLMAA